MDKKPYPDYKGWVALIVEILEENNIKQKFAKREFDWLVWANNKNKPIIDGK